MNDELTRRRFLKYGMATAGAFAASAVAVTVDKSSGFQIGRNKLNLGMSEANAMCGAVGSCAGGGGQCGAVGSCAGGGGQCGAVGSCAGGGGQCGAVGSCAGGGGQCGAVGSCAGGGGQCGAVGSCAGN